MSVDHINRRARAVVRQNIAGMGFCHTCMNCGAAPGQAYGPKANDLCFNCGYALYQDASEGPISETEALHMQVHRLKWCLRFELRLHRALAIHATTGVMPKGWAPAEGWNERAAKQTLEDIEKMSALTETWKDFIW